MSKINASQVLTNLDGKILKKGDTDKDLTVGGAVSNVLLNHPSGDKMRNFLLAKDFYKEGEIEVNSADVALIKTACEKSEIFNNLVLGQILEILESLKNEK